jgi:Holliday junction resolvase RusA-like endonuclease
MTVAPAAGVHAIRQHPSAMIALTPSAMHQPMSLMTMTTLNFIVPGKPCAKQSVRFTKSGRSYQPADVLAYHDRITFYAQQASNGGLMEGPLEISIVAYFIIPRSWPKKKQLAAAWHAQRPDADNLIKACLDGLKDIIFRDDAQVARLLIEKRWTSDTGALESNDHRNDTRAAGRAHPTSPSFDL